MLVIMLITFAAVTLFYRLALRGQHLDKVGLGAVAVAVLALVPLIWMATRPALSDYPQGLIKGELFPSACC
jgi:hypothetical protein